MTFAIEHIYRANHFVKRIEENSVVLCGVFDSLHFQTEEDARKFMIEHNIFMNHYDIADVTLELENT